MVMVVVVIGRLPLMGVGRHDHQARLGPVHCQRSVARLTVDAVAVVPDVLLCRRAFKVKPEKS